MKTLKAFSSAKWEFLKNSYFFLFLKRPFFFNKNLSFFEPWEGIHQHDIMNAPEHKDAPDKLKQSIRDIRQYRYGSKSITFRTFLQFS